MIPDAQHAPDAPGTRLDRFLLNAYPWLDRPTLEELFSSGQILLNSRPAKKGARLAPGDSVLCRNLPEPADLRLRPNPELPLRVVYEDESLLALDKPAGQPTHPIRWSESNTLANALVARHPSLADVGEDRLFPSLVHRLDVHTSGLVLAAKNLPAYSALRGQFQSFAVEKHYLALVHGSVDAPGSLDAPLVHQTRSPCKMAVARNPNRFPPSDVFPASTFWNPVGRGPSFTLLDVVIFSGVTHQIRCHLAAAGHPVAGDSLYGSPLSSPRHWLHASRIACIHPATGKPLEISCPLPPDWPPVER